MTVGIGFEDGKHLSMRLEVLEEIIITEDGFLMYGDDIHRFDVWSEERFEESKHRLR